MSVWLLNSCYNSIFTMTECICFHTHTLFPWESTMKWSSSLILRQSGWIQAFTLTNKPNQTHHFVSVLSNMLSVKASLSHCDWPWDVHYFQTTARLLLFWNHQHSKCCVITGKFIFNNSDKLISSIEQCGVFQLIVFFRPQNITDFAHFVSCSALQVHIPC